MASGRPVPVDDALDGRGDVPYGARVRFESLFADLEAELAAADRAEWDAEVAEAVRAERSRLQLTDRLRAHVGHRLVLQLAGGDVLDIVLVDVVGDCLLARPEPVLPGAEGGSIVPMHAVRAVSGLGPAALTDSSVVGSRVGFRTVLRAACRGRRQVRLRLLDVPGQLVGTIDRVGVDHLDLAEHPAGTPRRATAVSRVRCIPLAGVLLVHLDAGWD